MKLFYLFFSMSIVSFSQTAIYNKLNKNADYKEYISKENKHIKVGDTIQIGLPYAGTEFVFITQGNERTTSNLAYRKIVITKIKSIGKKKQGYKVYLEFKGFGLIPVLIDYEPAYYSKEIIFN